jgi:hypothetical protein
VVKPFKSRADELHSLSQRQVIVMLIMQVIAFIVLFTLVLPYVINACQLA